MVKLYCVGDNNVDIYQSLGKVFPGGCCLNVAIYARMLGHEAAFVSAVGSDRLGQLQLDTLRLYGVDTSGVHITDGHTAWCKILHQGNDRVFSELDNGAKQQCPVCEADIRKGQDGTYDMLYTCLEAFYEDGALRCFGDSSVPSFCDLSTFWERESLREYCEIFDYVALSGQGKTETEMRMVLQECIQYGAQMAIGTLGMNGSLVRTQEQCYKAEACRVEALDTLGAGDSWLTAFITSYLDGKNRAQEERSEHLLIPKSMSLASRFAASTCMHYGGVGNGIDFEETMI